MCCLKQCWHCCQRCQIHQTQPAFKPPYQPLQLYAGPGIAGAFVYGPNGRSAAKAEPDSAAATTIPPKIRFIEISSNLSTASGSPRRHAQLPHAEASASGLMPGGFLDSDCT